MAALATPPFLEYQELHKSGRWFVQEVVQQSQRRQVVTRDVGLAPHLLPM